MKKIAFVLLLIFVTFLAASCNKKAVCSAYGETKRYQKKASYWDGGKTR